MSEWFEVGMKVQCIDATGHRNIAVGAVYTLVRIARCDGCLRCFEPHAVLELAGIDNPHSPENGFDAKRFRPLRKRKTSIACFERLLKTEKVKTDA